MEQSSLDRDRLLDAVKTACFKLSPRVQLRNPVMFCVYLSAMIATALWVQILITGDTPSHEPGWFVGMLTFWLWLTVWMANFAEAVAEGRGKAQAASLKSLRREVRAKRIKSIKTRDDIAVIAASDLRLNDMVLVEAGDFIPGDGQVLDGIASVDESAITGESAPVIRESGGDSDAVTGGTRVLSDWLIIRIGANPGESFLDKMVGLVEGAKRQKTPSELALASLLAAMTLIFVIAVATLVPFSIIAAEMSGGQRLGIGMAVALLVCLIPTTIGGLLSAVGIAGMNRLLKANVIALSGRCVEAAGDINVLLLDKTGTITHGNRQASEFIVAIGVEPETMYEATMLASLGDNTPEGKSILQLARSAYHLTIPAMPQDAEIIAFSAETRVSGVTTGGRQILKGAADAIAESLQAHGASISPRLQGVIDQVARQGGTPLVVAEIQGDTARCLGVLHLKDVVKLGIKERLADLRKMGIKSMMITGDNPITAAAIAAEAGVDDYLAQATPESKLKLIRRMQAEGEMVGMVGDGTNDAPALAQSNVALCMNSGTQAAKEAANMVDLDSDPTKLIEIVQIGKVLLITRGALTTFSFANDIAKYFSIIPAAMMLVYPELTMLNVMELNTPYSAVLSAVIFNALIIGVLVPLALRGVKYRPLPAPALLRRHLLIYGIGGIIVPFIGIKAIDMALGAAGLA